MTLDELNGLPSAKAEEALLTCCGSQRWASALAARRPFASMDNLQKAAEDEWWKLQPHDWLEAFSHHPRIGERVNAGSVESREQAGTRGASDKTLLSLESLNRMYEEKFGFVFLIFATGKSADEMLEALRVRLQNRREVELKTAAGEQARITRLRLEKLLTADSSHHSG